jgi:hypothetical protein
VFRFTENPGDPSLPPALAVPVASMLWVRAKDLVGIVGDQQPVTSWPRFDGLTAPGAGMVSGTGALPVFRSSGEAYPFVSLVTGANPAVDGGYIDFGSMAVLVATRGFTAAVCVRIKDVGGGARVFDIGSDSTVTPCNLLLSQQTNIATPGRMNWAFVLGPQTSTTTKDPVKTNDWEVVVVRIDPVTNGIKVIASQKATDAAPTVALSDTTFATCFVGKSWRSNVPFSNMDIREIRLLNVALNDPDMQALHNQMSVAYGLPVM